MHHLEDVYDGRANALEGWQQREEAVMLLPTKTSSSVLNFTLKPTEEEVMKLHL